jgi:glutamine amidotransferase
MGVCLGLQLLFDQSPEFGNTKGLGLIPGSIEKFEVQQLNGYTYKVPQIQWNKIHEPFEGGWMNTPLKSCRTGDFMYFVHSYYAVPADKKYVLSNTVFGNKNYCSAVLMDNVFATQFHPEKSGLQGVNIYENWFKIHCK